MTHLPQPQPPYLATGFRDVDRTGDTEACHRCLNLIAGIPFFREIKEETFRIIAGTAPSSVLDAGCGPGADLVTLASRLTHDCSLTGLDASGSLLARAAEQTADMRARCSLIRGDITNIPCRDNVFDACRIDRVLQHIPDPEQGIHELARIIAPGGTLVAFDNDWDTVSISLDDADIAARIRMAWRDSFASGRIGRDLPRYFQESGLEQICSEPRTLTLTNLPLAEKVFDLSLLLDRMEQTGALAPCGKQTILEELHCRAEEGTFTSGYTGFIVQGKKPE